MEEGKPSGPILHLGHYDYDKELDEDLKNSETKIKRHHTQIYANGSQCDLTGNPRQTEVRVSTFFMNFSPQKVSKNRDPYDL